MVEVADDAVVGRVRQALHDRNGLVVNPVHHHVGPLPRGDHLLAEGVVGDDHRDAHHQQEHDRQGHVEGHQHGVESVAERKGEHHGADAHRLEERRDADLRKLLQGRVAHDRAVGLQDREEHQREKERETEPAQDEAVGQVVVRDQHANEDQGADRCRQRHQEVDRKDQLRTEEAVKMETGYYLLYEFHENQKVKLWGNFP